MAKPRRTIPGEAPPSSRKTVEVDPAWLEEGRASRAGRSTRTSIAGGSGDRRTIDVDPAWLERTTTAPPVVTRGKQKPPPLPPVTKETEEPEDEAPARGAIPPPLPRTPRSGKKPSSSR